MLNANIHQHDTICIKLIDTKDPKCVNDVGYWYFVLEKLQFVFAI